MLPLVAGSHVREVTPEIFFPVFLCKPIIIINFAPEEN